MRNNQQIRQQKKRRSKTELSHGIGGRAFFLLRLFLEVEEVKSFQRPVPRLSRKHPPPQVLRKSVCKDLRGANSVLSPFIASLRDVQPGKR